MSDQHDFKVFLSHAEEDLRLVHRVWGILDHLEATPYMHELYPDYRQDIPTGIRDVLQNCVMCITFLTQGGINSQWVQQELGVAYAFGKIIVPVVETGVEYKGFVQMVSRIPFEPEDADEMIYKLIYAVRTHLLGHDEIPISLVCSNHHEHDYTLPSTYDLNKAMRIGHIYVFKCETCGIEIALDPKTLEIRQQRKWYDKYVVME